MTTASFVKRLQKFDSLTVPQDFSFISYPFMNTPPVCFLVDGNRNSQNRNVFINALIVLVLSIIT